MTNWRLLKKKSDWQVTSGNNQLTTYWRFMEKWYRWHSCWLTSLSHNIRTTSTNDILKSYGVSGLPVWRRGSCYWFMFKVDLLILWEIYNFRCAFHLLVRRSISQSVGPFGRFVMITMAKQKKFSKRVRKYTVSKPIELESPGCSAFEANLKSFKTWLTGILYLNSFRSC